MNIRTRERLLIRPMAETDLHDFLAYQTHPRNLEYVPGEALSEERAAAFLARQAKMEIGDGGGYVALAVEVLGEGRMIGEVGLGFGPKNAEPKRQGELGFSLHPDYHGKGYATEAAQLLLDYAFRDLNLHRLTAGCDARNTPSYRLMERLGMRREGHFLQNSFVKGDWRDSYHYALLQSEWLAQQNTNDNT